MARDIHLAEIRGDRPSAARFGALTGCASTRATRRISRSSAASTSSGSQRHAARGGVRRPVPACAGPVADAIAADRAAGLTPLAISAVAGSTNTGSVDLAVDPAALARARGCGCTWTRPTAAPRGSVARDAARVPGLELADSVTVDPHKWFFQAYDIGALVVRRREDLRDTFHRSPEYYASSRPEDEPLNWYEYSIEGTRRFRALKLWMSWKHLGTRGLAASRRAQRRPGRVPGRDACVTHRTSSSPSSPSSRSSASVICPDGMGPVADRPTSTRTENDLQRALEVDGAAWVSVTTLRGSHLPARRASSTTCRRAAEVDGR